MQIVLLVQKAYGEVDWILSDHYFSRLQKYLDYWMAQMDQNGNGLSEWISSPHTGMDNQHERAGYWRDQFCEGVDLNCYLVRELKAFSRLCRLADKPGLAAAYMQKSQDLAERIRTLMWHEQDGFFYDRNARAGQYPMSRHAGWAASMNSDAGEWIRVKSVSSFAAIWSGVASPEQAHRMIYDHLFNPREFWTAFPVPALACSERWYSRDFLPADLGCDWRAKTWILTNYMIYHGLRRYGCAQLASLLAHATQQLVTQSGNCEYYDAETGEGNGLNPFWGWSLLGHFMRYEEQSPAALCAVEE